MITQSTKKVFTTSDGQEWESFDRAQTEEFFIALRKAAAKELSDGEEKIARSISAAIVANKSDFIAILSNRKPRKDRGTKRTKAKTTKPAEKEAKAPMAGITFGKGGVVKGEEA